MTTRDSYPAGVPCWIDLTQDDIDALMVFYSGLFGWQYQPQTPPDAPFTYAYAMHEGGSVGGVGGPSTAGDPTGWTMYVSVSSADEAVAAVTANGGKVLAGPDDLPTGRVAQCVDPEGARFGLWQPGTLAGSEVVNIAGSWVLSELNTREPEGAARFYRAVFGWEVAPFGIPDDPSGFFHLAGYGAFLAERDPDVKAFQESGAGPEHYGDAVAILQPVDSDAADVVPHWSTTFAVDDADAAFARALELGAAEVVAPFDTPYTRQSTVRDPQGAPFNLSQYRPDGAA